MVYGVFYLPGPLSDPLLRDEHHFDDSKVLTPAVRSSLMQTLCTPGTEDSPSALHSSCGWAISALSARDIGAGMMRPAAAAPYNLNSQAFDATVSLIRGVMDRGVNVAEIYVDTVGPPAAYQKRLERLFPTARVTVAKKADSLYPCVSAASVCAKVTRDAALEVLYEAVIAAPAAEGADDDGETGQESWGSGYPSDGKCVAWLRRNMHPVFGWGPECRFSWGTAKDMLEPTGTAAKEIVKVDWPLDDDGENSRMTDFLVSGSSREKDADELGTWFGTPADVEAF
jgi:ribonuclease H2 subunit A